MNAVVRWKTLAIFSVTLVFAASGQANGALPAAKNALADGVIRNVDRTVLHGDIVHYRYEVKVGPGQFDVIRLHRVVKEQHPYQPIRTVGGLFMLTGAPNTFEMIYLEPAISPATSWDHSIAVYLAKNGVDVWGMDYAWALVPAKTTNFHFMKTWGIEKDAQHAQIALYIARSIRGMTGQGFGQIHLLGFSWGVFVAYTVAGEESQMPSGLRSVKGIIPVDASMKVKDNSYRLAACSLAADSQNQLDAGVYHSDSGAFIKQIGDLAKSEPYGESPIAPPLTNLQFTFLLGASASPPPPVWHFVGGYFDGSGVPTGLRFTDPILWVDMIRAVPPYVPMKASWELYAVMCDNVDVSIDDHFKEIAIPILYVGAAGGEGEYGYYTTSLTASKDITKFTVRLLSDDQRAFDYGHADQFSAVHAETLTWKPILDWILAHR